LFEVADKDAFRPPRQQPGEIVLAKVQRQLAKIVALERQDVESVELDLIVMPAGVSPLKSEMPSTPSRHCLAICGPSRLSRGTFPKRFVFLHG
jgi:hypothetical protein